MWNSVPFNVEQGSFLHGTVVQAISNAPKT